MSTNKPSGIDQLLQELADVKQEHRKLRELVAARDQDVSRLCEAVFGTPRNEDDTGQPGLATAVDQCWRKLSRIEENTQELCTLIGARRTT